MSGLEILTMLLILLVKHLVADFMLQNMWIVRAKGIYGHPGGLVHAGLHGIGSLPAIALAPLGWSWVIAICVAEAVIHYHIDWTKEQALKRIKATVHDRSFWMLIGIDQFAHQATYLAMIWAVLALL